jgi:dTDP-glucose 4,6-dehydratase
MPAHKKVAVLGSNSFSGSDFIDLLLEKGTYDVVGISRSPEKAALFLPYKRHNEAPFRFYQMDLNDDMPAIVGLLDDFQPDYVVNFAAQSEVAPSWEHPEHWFQTNLVSLALLTNALRKRKYLKRYMHISSPEAYGSCEGNITEDASLNPSTPYAASKAAADMFLATLFKNEDFPLVTIRSTNVYGAHQQLWKIIPRTFIYLKLGKNIEFHGCGKAVKSYIHIRDISNGELLALENGLNGEIYNLSPSSGHEVRDVVSRICTILGYDFTERTVAVAERPGQDARYVIDSTKARTKLNWQPVIDLDEGLAGVTTWIENYSQSIAGQSLQYVHSR